MKTSVVSTAHSAPRVEATLSDDLLRTDHVVIRGRRLDLDKHVDPKLFDPDHIASLRQRVREARPFAHLVTHDWFNPVLLELVREEFDLLDTRHWRVIRDEQQLMHRSTVHGGLGPASQIYFGIVNSGWFVDLLAQISGIDDLLPDAGLLGGGLHETRPGGIFGIHRDFDRHVRHGLDNKMVFITYLNRNWQAEWGAELELWSVAPAACALRIPPEFGTSVLLLHGPTSFHGHPEPMTAPAGQTRRSVASYYYQNRHAVRQRVGRVSSVFLFAHRSKRLRRLVGRAMPPFLVDAIKKIVAR